MRHGATTGRRSRNHRNNRNGGGGGNQNRTKVFDSNGPDVRIRGTAHQIHDKYMTLARDAAVSGDIVLEENYSQYAEHYKRIITRWQETLATYERTGVIEDYSVNAKNSRQDKTVEKTSGNTNDLEENKVPEAKKIEVKQEEDLGLPESIVGAKTKSEEILEDA